MFQDIQAEIIIMIIKVNFPCNCGKRPFEQQKSVTKLNLNSIILHHSSPNLNKIDEWTNAVKQAAGESGPGLPGLHDSKSSTRNYFYIQSSMYSNQ